MEQHARVEAGAIAKKAGAAAMPRKKAKVHGPQVQHKSVARGRDDGKQGLQGGSAAVSPIKKNKRKRKRKRLAGFKATHDAAVNHTTGKHVVERGDEGEHGEQDEGEHGGQDEGEHGGQDEGEHGGQDEGEHGEQDEGEHGGQDEGDDEGQDEDDEEEQDEDDEEEQDEDDEEGQDEHDDEGQDEHDEEEQDEDDEEEQDEDDEEGQDEHDDVVLKKNRAPPPPPFPHAGEMSVSENQTPHKPKGKKKKDVSSSDKDGEDDNDKQPEEGNEEGERSVSEKQNPHKPKGKKKKDASSSDEDGSEFVSRKGKRKADADMALQLRNVYDKVFVPGIETRNDASSYEEEAGDSFYYQRVDGNKVKVSTLGPRGGSVEEGRRYQNSQKADKGQRVLVGTQTEGVGDSSLLKSAEALLKLKRKPGRPKKEEAELQGGVKKKRGRPRKEESDGKQPVKKKRGRPRKEESDGEQPVKKKRGRPRKEESDGEQPVKKKRGRPRKEESDGKQPVKKKRGRPRKEKIDLMEDEDQLEGPLPVLKDVNKTTGVRAFRNMRGCDLAFAEFAGQEWRHEYYALDGETPRKIAKKIGISEKKLLDMNCYRIGYNPDKGPSLHAKKSLKKGTVVEIEAGVFQGPRCEKCGRIFNSEKSLKRHISSSNCPNADYDHCDIPKIYEEIGQYVYTDKKG